MTSEFGPGGPGPGRFGPVGLRTMTTADVDAVAKLENTLFPIDAWPRQMFVDELGQPSRHYLIAETDGKMVGYAGLMCLAPVADVQTIAVLPDFEGLGIGTALLTALLTEARRRGAAEVLLEVRADNPRAQRLYRRFGFKQIHLRPRYYRDGVDALVMRAQLGEQPDVGEQP